jgi:protein SCO1
MQLRFSKFGAWLLGLLFALFASACGDAAFKNTDITGATYAQGFALTDHNGTPRTLADFKGRVVMVFFGFTQCPDVCPSTLAEMRSVLSKLGTDAARVQVIFITVDPERDTKELLAQYVPSFNPSFLGLYADPAITLATAKSFKVFYQKVPGKTPGSYTVDHTAASYVFDAQGKIRLFVRHQLPSDAPGAAEKRLLHDLKKLLAEKPPQA